MSADLRHPQTTGPLTGYAGAVDHYTSPSRRDPVKRLWEEPELARLLDAAVARTAATTALRVADVGCGTGVGLELLRATPSLQRPDAPTLAYLGLDLDEALLGVARARFAADPRVRFVRADVRDGIPGAPHDLVVSSGVPYSHLLPDELEDVLADVLACARDAEGPVVLVVDVLGRYSIEWTSQWDERRWSYRMSFFTTDAEPDATDMTVHGGAELRDLIGRAARRAACELADVACHDRSIMVGRHTTTGEYTPGLHPYRELVNGLFDPDVEVALDELRFDVALPEAPGDVTAFFTVFASAWNTRIERAMATARGLDPRRIADDLQPRLARDLLALETSSQQGLGVGHSLTAVVVTRPGHGRS